MIPFEEKEYDWQGKRILIAEDEEINYFFLETLLLKQGAEVLHAWNGRQAIDFIQNQEVDLILMDIKMPIMDGYEATRKIKKVKPAIPIIAQTAYALGNDEIKCVEAGCDEHIVKPIRKNLLYSIIERQFQMAAG